MTSFVDETITIVSKFLVSPLEIEPVTSSGFLGGSYSHEYDKVLEHHHRKHHDLRLPLFLPRPDGNHLLQCSISQDYTCRHRILQFARSTNDMPLINRLSVVPQIAPGQICNSRSLAKPPRNVYNTQRLNSALQMVVIRFFIRGRKSVPLF